jgi:hypothetical protein
MVTVAAISNFETNVTRKGRAGRPAQSGERYPSGKLKPADKREGGPAPALIKRTVEAALRGAADPLYGTSLGVLFLRGEITASQLAAGNAFARLQGRYDRAMGMPCRFTASPDYGTARSLSDKGPMADDELAAVKDRHARTMGLLGGAMQGSVVVAAGDGGLKRLDGEAARPVRAYDARRTTALLERVCVDDLACESYELDRLRAALQLLVPWFGVGPQKGA